MSDIFISYSQKDREVASKLAQELEQLGFTVFYDVEIVAGAVWRDTIMSALQKSSVIIVLWSHSSIQSEWVRTEANLALDENKLLPVLISNIEIPLGFKHIQTLDLSHLELDNNKDEFLTTGLIKAIESFTQRKRSTSNRGRKPNTPGDRVVIDNERKYKPLKHSSKIQVFIAHASADKPELMPVVKVLIDQGFRLWIDKPQEIGLDQEYESKIARDRIMYGNDWKESIRIAVKKADVVLAFWSHDAVDGRREQFHYEVYLGMMQQKLNQCRINDVEIEQIGMPYTFDQIADLADINSDEYHPELDYLMQDINAKYQSPWKWW